MVIDVMYSSPTHPVNRYGPLVDARLEIPDTIDNMVLKECFMVIKSSNYTIYCPHNVKRKNTRCTRNDPLGMLLIRPPLAVVL